MIFLSTGIMTKDEFNTFEKEGIPWSQIMAYVGPQSNPENHELYKLLHERGVKVMISAAPTYDKLKDPEERKAAYQKIIDEGADVIESDLPIEVDKALKGIFSKTAPNARYFGKRKSGS